MADQSAPSLTRAQLLAGARLRALLFLRSPALWVATAVVLAYVAGGVRSERPATAAEAVVMASEYFCIVFPLFGALALARGFRRGESARELVASRPVAASVFAAADLLGLLACVALVWALAVVGTLMAVAVMKTIPGPDLCGAGFWLDLLRTLPLGAGVGPLPVMAFLTLVMLIAALPVSEFVVLAIALLLWAAAALTFSLAAPLAITPSYDTVVGYGAWARWLLLNRTYGVLLGLAAFFGTVLVRARVVRQIRPRRPALVAGLAVVALVAGVALAGRLAAAPPRRDIAAADIQACLAAVKAQDPLPPGPAWHVAHTDGANGVLEVWAERGQEADTAALGRACLELLPQFSGVPGFRCPEQLVVVPGLSDPLLVASALVVGSPGPRAEAAKRRYACARLVRAWWRGFAGGAAEPKLGQPGLPGGPAGAPAIVRAGESGVTAGTLLAEWAVYAADADAAPATLDRELEAWRTLISVGGPSATEAERRQQLAADESLEASGAHRSWNEQEVKWALDMWGRVATVPAPALLAALADTKPRPDDFGARALTDWAERLAGRLGLMGE